MERTLLEKGYIRVFALYEIVDDGFWKFEVVNPNTNSYCSIRDEMMYRVGYLVFDENRSNNCITIRPICAEGHEFEFRFECLKKGANPFIIEISNPGKDYQIYDYIYIVNREKCKFRFKSFGIDSKEFQVEEIIDADSLPISVEYEIFSQKSTFGLASLTTFVDGEVQRLKQEYISKETEINASILDIETNITIIKNQLDEMGSIDEKEQKKQELLDIIKEVRESINGLDFKYKNEKKKLEENFQFVKLSKTEREYIYSGYSHHVDFLLKSAMYYPQLQEEALVDMLRDKVLELKDTFDQIEEILA